MTGYELSGEIIGADQLQEVLARFPDLARRSLADALNKTAYNMEGYVKGVVPRHDGQLMDSMHTKEAKPMDLEATVGTNLNYAAHVEYGTRPHFPPYKFGTPLAKWAQDKLGDARLAILVARKIAKVGTKGQFFMKKTREEGTDMFVRNIRNVLTDIMSMMGGH